MVQLQDTKLLCEQDIEIHTCKQTRLSIQKTDSVHVTKIRTKPSSLESFLEFETASEKSSLRLGKHI